MSLGSGGPGAPLSSMHLRKSSIFCWSAAERFGPRNTVTPPPAPGGGAGREELWAFVPALPLPLSAIDTAATPTAVIAAATRDNPSGPSLMVNPLFLFSFITTPVRRVPGLPGLTTIKPAGYERRLRRG